MTVSNFLMNTYKHSKLTSADAWNADFISSFFFPFWNLMISITSPPDSPAKSMKHFKRKVTYSGRCSGARSRRKPSRGAKGSARSERLDGAQLGTGVLPASFSAATRFSFVCVSPGRSRGFPTNEIIRHLRIIMRPIILDIFCDHFVCYVIELIWLSFSVRFHCPVQ